MRQITHWLVDAHARIWGELVSPDADPPCIHTSPVVSRDGNVVTTHSGSHYELVDPPHPYLQWDVTRTKNWGGATCPLDAIDKMIARRAEKLLAKSGEAR